MGELHRALLIEPDYFFRSSLKKVLVRGGFEVLEASSLEEALKILEDTKVSLITTELILIDARGPEILQKIQGASPDSVLLVLTAFTELIPQQGVPNCDDVLFLSKPSGAKEILEALSRHAGPVISPLLDKMSEENGR